MSFSSVLCVNVCLVFTFGIYVFVYYIGLFRGLSPFSEGVLFFFFQFYLFIYFLLYNIVLVLPYSDMTLPWVYMCSPS